MESEQRKRGKKVTWIKIVHDIIHNVTSDVQIVFLLYFLVLQRYLTFYDQRKGQPLQVNLTTPKPVETPKPEESSEETSKESTAEAETTSAVEQEVIKSVPKLYKTGTRQLLDKIKENRDVLHSLDDGLQSSTSVKAFERSLKTSTLNERDNL